MSKEDTEEDPLLLAMGAHGKVYTVDEKTVKKVGLLYEEVKSQVSIYEDTVRELAFLTVHVHPRVPKVIEIKQIGPDVEIFMERGEMTLNTWIDQTSDIKERIAAIPIIVAQVASVLTYIEQHGFIHADLSINNILLDAKTMQIKVIDWGGIIYDPYIFQGKHVRTTTGFISPEMRGSKKRLTTQHDVFSLGCCLLMVVTGKLPPSKPCGVPKDVRSLVSKEIAELLGSMLKRDPNKRISAAELLKHPFVVKHPLVVKHVPLPVLSSPKEGTSENKASSYMKKQFDINAVMREIVVDWMYVVTRKYRIQHAFVLAVALLDRFLAKSTVHRCKLQLLSCACMVLAESLLYSCSHPFDYWIYISKNAFTVDEFQRMVECVQTTLNNQLFWPLFDRELRKYSDDLNYSAIKCICLDSTRSVTDESIPVLIELYTKLCGDLSHAQTMSIIRKEYIPSKEGWNVFLQA